ncbi:MAG TPA: HD domain-containing protein [Thermoplasmata archaeon]|nr:HD domain-containing protein [Thermoplasmata archaeon]
MARARARSGAGKSIFDPVHGPISLPPAAVALLGTPEFQRLWGIRQTGFAHLVFPGANHTRLEHSLGTYWVAGQMAERLGLPDATRRQVEAAALLHDLGHPPFSHTLDGPLHEVLGIDHEQLSRARIEGREPTGAPATGAVAEALRAHGLAPPAVADLIDPGPGRRVPPLPGEILHGAIDADRIDYMQRDAHYTGVAHGAVDAVRLLDTLRARGEHLAFAEKGRGAVEGFLVGRALMYSTVYYHKTVRAAESMAQAAVERLPGYPGDAGRLFALTDGELLVRLRDAGGISAELADGLLARRLYKRVFGWRSIPPAARGGWRRLLHRPTERRALEDELAARLRAPPGSVLLDLGGLEPRGRPAEDWRKIGLVVDDVVTRPFRREGPWRLLAVRPPAEWAVSVYAAPNLRRAAEALRPRLARWAP